MPFQYRFLRLEKQKILHIAELHYKRTKTNIIQYLDQETMCGLATTDKLVNPLEKPYTYCIKCREEAIKRFQIAVDVLVAYGIDASLADFIDAHEQIIIHGEKFWQLLQQE